MAPPIIVAVSSPLGSGTSVKVTTAGERASGSPSGPGPAIGVVVPSGLTKIIPATKEYPVPSAASESSDSVKLELMKSKAKVSPVAGLGTPNGGPGKGHIKIDVLVQLKLSAGT
jgi:hypothetical protein